MFQRAHIARLPLAALALLTLTVLPAQAEALSNLLFGQDETTVEGGAIAYAAEINLDIDNGALKSALKDASVLAVHQKHGVPDIASLIVRAKADQERLKAALFGEAHYGGKIEITIAGQPVDKVTPAAVPHGDGGPIQVSMSVVAGPVFTFRDIQLDQSAPTSAQPDLSGSAYGLRVGSPAKSGTIVAALSRIVEGWRSAGYPLAQVHHKLIEADHDANAVDVKIIVDAGPPAVYGWLSVSGTERLDAGKVAEYSDLQPGEQFNPSDLKKARNRLRKLESIGSVRIVEGDSLDGNGGIPVTMEIKERKPRYFGGTASVSTFDGGELTAYWGHRNLYGGSERLRVDAGVSNIGEDSLSELQFSAGAIIAKPAVFDIDTDLVTEFRAKREVPDTYDSYTGFAKVGLAKRFDDRRSGSVALSATQTYVEDAFGKEHYTLLALPTEGVYDSRDSTLDATQGLHAILQVTPTADLANAHAYLATRIQIASYRALDPNDRAILAGRLTFANVAGADLEDIPATDRLFAGGGGSVRGYEYRSLGPDPASDTGGRSLLAASLELRLKATESIGIVPFVDIASVSRDSLPSFSETPYVGAGLGLRYFSALGPLRLDVAVPLTERDDRQAFGFYVGLGQAF